MSDPAIPPAIIISAGVERDNLGKISIIGCFNSIESERFPALFPLFYVTPILTNLWGDIKQTTVVLELHLEGKKLAQVSNHFSAPKSGEQVRREGLHHCPFPIRNFKAYKAGKYQFVVVIDGIELGRADFLVKQSLNSSINQSG